MLRRVSEKLVRLHVFDLCCLGILYNLLIYIWSKNLFPFRSFCNRKLGKQTQKLGISLVCLPCLYSFVGLYIYNYIYIYSYSFVNTHMVWHLIVKDDRLFWSCNLFPISSLRPGYRTLTTVVIFTDKIGRPARVLGPSPFGLDQLGATSGWAKTGEGTGFTSRLTDQYRCMHMVWESIWWCLMWLCMVVSCCIWFTPWKRSKIKRHENMTDTLACKAHWDETRSMWKCHWNIAQSG